MYMIIVYKKSLMSDLQYTQYLLPHHVFREYIINCLIMDIRKFRDSTFSLISFY
jgi:hypothetical protein